MLQSSLDLVKFSEHFIEFFDNTNSIFYYIYEKFLHNVFEQEHVKVNSLRQKPFPKTDFYAKMIRTFQ